MQSIQYGFVVRLLCFGLLAGCATGSPTQKNDAGDPCSDVTCSGHGRCVVDQGQAECLCEEGFLVNDLNCVQDPCTPNPCTEPPRSTCDNQTTLRTWQSPGQCSVTRGAATCDYGTGEATDCSKQNKQCADGACVPHEQSQPTPGDFVITELMFDPVAIPDTDGEWFEIVNHTDHGIDLTAMQVYDDNGNHFTVQSATALMVPAGGYFVFGPNADPTQNGGVTVDYEYFGLMLNNDTDGVTLVWKGTTIDEVHYDDSGVFPHPYGASLSLDPNHIDATDNDTGSSWCVATTSYDTNNEGTPGAPNDACTADACTPNPCTSPPDPSCNNDILSTSTLNPGTCSLDASSQPQCDYGIQTQDCSTSGQICSAGQCVPVSGPAPGSLVITEIMANPDSPLSDTAAEWVEILNVTQTPIDIQGMVIRDNGTDHVTVPTNNPLVVPSGAYFLMGRNGDTTANGGLTLDYVYGTTFTLANTADEVILEFNSTVIDEVDYDQSAGFPVTAGRSMTLSPSTLDATSNDLATNWCRGTSTYSPGNQGTPGLTNDTCP
ncbi:MAG: lamin tail domain-containing protein [Deltaproteobacteria bacterium]|nr:lamin tail domain-containing protein [Deltaproteobacteria bacterium]